MRHWRSEVERGASADRCWCRRIDEGTASAATQDVATHCKLSAACRKACRIDESVPGSQPGRTVDHPHRSRPSLTKSHPASCHDQCIWIRWDQRSRADRGMAGVERGCNGPRYSACPSNRNITDSSRRRRDGRSLGNLDIPKSVPVECVSRVSV